MEMEIAKYLLSALLGCCAGSFLCLCADRFQRDESIFFPRSHCAGCGHTLVPRDLVPLFSYLCQRGRCRYCGRKLPFSLFWWEAVTGCFFLLAAWLPGSLPLLGVRWLSLSLLLLLSWLDMEELQLYEELFYPLGILFLVLRVLKGQSLLPGLVGAALLGGFLQLIRRLSPRGMGEGDPKLAAVLGLWLGPLQGFRSFFLAMGTALFFVLVKGIRAREDCRAKMREPVPLAPFFCGCGLLLQVLELAGPMDFGLEPGMVPFLGMLELESFPGREKMEQIGRWLRRKLEPWPDQLLGVQLGKDEVTLVQVRRKDAVWEVERALELSWPERIRAGLGRRQTEDAVLWLREICAKRGFTAREAALSLGMDLMAFRELSLPGLSFQEQQEAAPWEILQQIPYEPGTFQLALAPFPEHPETLLAGAVPDEVLAACRALAEGMEWHILRLEAAPQAWGRWLEKETAPFLLVLSGTSLQGAWYERGRLLGTCRLDQGAAGTDEVTEEREAIFRQLWEKAGPNLGIVQQPVWGWNPFASGPLIMKKGKTMASLLDWGAPWAVSFLQGKKEISAMPPLREAASWSRNFGTGWGKSCWLVLWFFVWPGPALGPWWNGIWDSAGSSSSRHPAGNSSGGNNRKPGKSGCGRKTSKKNWPDAGCPGERC